jgi:hypothetical protein
MATVIYVGGLPSGSIVDPITTVEVPFVRGEPFTISDNIAATLGPEFKIAATEEN